MGRVMDYIIKDLFHRYRTLRQNQGRMVGFIRQEANSMFFYKWFHSVHFTSAGKNKIHKIKKAKATHWYKQERDIPQPGGSFYIQVNKECRNKKQAERSRDHRDYQSQNPDDKVFQ